jgi:hypothetical protein
LYLIGKIENYVDFVFHKYPHKPFMTLFMFLQFILANLLHLYIPVKENERVRYYGVFQTGKERRMVIRNVLTA